MLVSNLSCRGTATLRLLASLAALAVPTTITRAADPILIGVSGPLTGDAAGSGQEAMDGAKLAVDQLNAKGGILGRPVQIIEGDDRCDPKEAAIVAQKFVAQKVAATASHYCSGAALASIPIFREAGLLYIDGGAVSSKIPGSGYDRLFMTLYSGAMPGVYAANMAVKKLHMTRLAVVDDRTPANGEFAAAFQKRAKELGATVVLAGHVTQGDKDFSAFVGLTLPEAKQPLASIQRAVVTSQVDSHGQLRPCCRSCSGRCQLKDWRGHRIATLFGEVTVRLPTARLMLTILAGVAT
jgi:ABC-type branched-subunit amino acid transport system substrate-binding protein